MASPINNTYVQTQSVINTPGGGNTTVQYNKNGSFAGDNGLKYNESLKELSVQGNINVGGWVKGKIYTNTYNFFLTGGNSGQVLTTDGNGNLSWTDQTGGGGSGNYSNSNVSAYLSTFTGNISAGNIKTNNLLYANGVAWNFAGTYSNSNVANYLPTYTGNVGAGNIKTNNLLYANGVAWNFAGTYSNANVANYLPTYTGNISASFFAGNGSQLTGITTSRISNGNSNVNVTTVNGNIVVTANSGTARLWTFDTTGNLTAPGSIIPNANITYDLGNTTNRWRDLYLSGNTIQLGNATISTADTGDVGVPGLSEVVSVPNSITTYGSPIGTGYTGTPVIIDQVTYYLANPANSGERGTAVPATYTPTMNSGNITSITITATGSYPDRGVDWDVLNEDSMWALPQGTQMDYANLWTAIEEIETVGNPPYGVISAGVASTTTTKGTIGNITVSTGDNFSLTTSSLSSVTAPCYIGLSTEYVADTEFNDDITVVQVGWTVIVNSVTYTVTYIDPAPPANQYRITVDGAAGFVSGTSYTFTNPVPVQHNWTIDQYGTMTAPGGGEISQINDDFKIEVTGTDVIDLRTAGGDLILDAAGNLVINGPINSSTGVASLNLTGGNVSLTSTDDNTTSLNMTTTQVELYAGVDVTIASGVIIPSLETDYTDATNVLETLFIQNENEVGYPWGITLPVSYLTYDELIQLEPGTFPNQATCTTQANNTKNTWELWQDTIAQSNVRIISNELNWIFGSDGILNFPGSALIDTGENNFEVRGANAVNFEAVNVVNIYTDTANNGHQWQFGDDGNLTLPSNNSSINYANGSPYGGGGGGSGYIIPYTVDTFVANTPPGFGEITFCNLEGSNSAPATAQKLFISESPTNEQSMGTIFQQWTSNSYRGTLSLNNGSDSQATFNISNGRIYFDPENYRGFRAGLNQIWSDDCSINQLIITNASAPVFYNTEFLTEDDVFHARGLDTGNFHIMLNIYGSSQYNPINPNDLWNTFTSFVDNVLFNGETLRTDVNAIRTQFYNNAGNFRGNIPTQDLYQWFEFPENDGADYFGTAPTTATQGTDATLRIRVNPNNTYTVLGIATAGTGYLQGDNLIVAGTSLGGATPANDLTLLIDTVNGDGAVTAVSFLSGDAVYPWPSNFISDGDDDQYDTGNYINTNLASEISYANGLPQTDSSDFGGGDYCVMYYQSFFCMVTTGSSISELFYSGNLGFDGDGILNWTGLRSNQNVIANNNARYAYFDIEYLDGELTPTVGTTYNMVLDSAGINLDGFYAYNDVNTNNYFFGSNNTWRIESQNELFVQSYNDMRIQTLVNQRGIGETGPAISIDAGRGSPGQKEINATAGQGGTVNIRAGNAGGDDGINGLGNTGGSININAGMGTGSSEAGSVYINGGQTDSPAGRAGNVDIGTYAGPNGSGRVTINTNDGTQRNWAFNANGSTIYPTLSVTRGDRTGTLTGQTLLFGDSTQGVLISTPNGTADNNDSPQLIINPGAGYTNTTGEGGDIYLYAGRGGSGSGSGGDIKIRGGLGPADGWGGYIDITGGEAAGNGHAGYIEIIGGQSSNSIAGYVRIEGGQGPNGAEANITGGTGTAGPGGGVNITGGTSSNGVTEYGNVNITSGASTWTFDNTGNLVLPSNDFTVNYANGAQVTFGGAALGNVTFDDVTVQGVNQLNLSAGPDYTANLAYLQVRAGDVASHIHFDTGNNEAYDLIVGNDQKFVQVSSTGNIIMSSYDGNTSYTMKLDTTGNVTFPGVLGVVGGTTTPVTGNNEAGNPGVSGSQTFNAQVSYFPTVGDIQVGWTVTGNNLTGTTTVTVVDEYSPGFFEITTDTSVTNAFWYGDAYTFTGPGISNWVFANDNILTFPRDEIANTDPYLRIEGGTNPRILSEDASLAGPANLEITALNTIFTGVTGSEIRIYADDGEIGSTGNLQLWANAGSNVAQYSWTFDNTGNLTTPSNLVISASGIGTGTAIAQSDAPLLMASSEANGRATIGWYENPIGPGNVVQVGLNDSGTGSMTVLTGDYSDTTYVWDFDNTGNLTLPTGGALNITGNISSNGYARFSGTFDESQASTAGLYMGYAGGTPRIMFGTGNTLQTFEIDNDGGNLRFYQPGSTKATLTSTGNLSTAGSITATGKIGYANGGTVTQAGTGQGVTIHQLTGQITLAKSSWTAGDLEIFNVNCNKVGTYDYVMAQVINGTESTFFNVVAFPYVPLANTFQIQVRAMETTTSTPLIQFYIMKAAIA